MPAAASRSVLARAFRLGGLALFVGALLPLAVRPDLSTDGQDSVRVVDRDGRLLREVRPDGSALPLRLRDVPPFALDALLATEDRRFYHHPGVDGRAVLRALRQNAAAGRTVSGGSTLTMQLARRLRSPDGGRRGWTEKAREAHLALRLELWYSKDDMIEGWLARAPFGRQTRGLAAASHLYFGKRPSALTPAEAALLVGLPQGPSRLDPYRHPERARSRQRHVLESMVEVGSLDSARARQIADLPLDLRPAAGRFLAPHFVERLIADGHTEQSSGGVLRTSLDLPLQREAERLARGHVARMRRERVGQVAAVVLDNATGDLLAYVGSADFFDDAAHGQTDGAQALRQPGSALKPFTYAAAFEHLGYGPATLLPDTPTAVTRAGGAFVPANYDGRFHGDVPVRRALASSYNVPAVVVAERLGVEELLAFYRSAGLHALTRSAEHYGAAMTLGAGEVRLAELAQAYALLARCATGSECARLDGAPAPFTPATAALITDILADPEARASAFGRGSALELPFPVAVKTGTSKDYRDTWAVGYSPTHTVAVWAGNFSGAPMREVSGVSGAAPVLAALFETLGPGGDFPALPGVGSRTVCPESGHAAGAHCPSRREERFAVSAPSLAACPVHQPERPAPAVVGHSPTRPAGSSPPAARILPVDRFAITAPSDGAVYTLDPVLRADFQRLALRAHLPPALTHAVFLLDGAPVGPAGEALFWTLEPGRHRLTVRARAPGGRVVTSAPVSFTVRSPAPPSPRPSLPAP